MGRPNFIGIGAHKSGTSWLARILASHPNAWIPAKELHFFDQYWSRGTGWYESCFDRASGRVCGEFTPMYMFDPACCNRIAETCPDARLICMLRNPVDRAVSAYRMMRQRFGEKRSFEACCAEDSELVDRGRYAEQLSRFQNYFSDDRILVLLFEETVCDTEGLRGVLGDFLGLDGSGFTFDHDRSASTQPRVPILRSAMTRGSRAMRRRGMDGVANFLSRTVGPWARAALDSSQPIDVDIPNSLRASIIEQLDVDKRALEDSLGRETGWW